MHRRSNPDPGVGDELRDQAADMLASQYGEARREVRVRGKKVDVFFEQNSLGTKTRVYVEAKDYAKPLRRTQVQAIGSDYGGIIREKAPALLLIITRSGLTPDAQEWIDENPTFRHQTIWEIEASLIELESYLRFQIEAPKASRLAEYYIPTGFAIRRSTIQEHQEHITITKQLFKENRSCFDAV